ncbi:hypothetical protein pb186bvf_013440 [Paramecium bursaria]
MDIKQIQLFIKKVRENLSILEEQCQDQLQQGKNDQEVQKIMNEQFATGEEDDPLIDQKDFKNIPESGYYFVKVDKQTHKLYLDKQEYDVWIRLHQKIDQIMKPTIPDYQVDQKFTKWLLEIAEDIGISDNPFTINCIESWILQDFYLDEENMNQNITILEQFTNIINGLTPSGSNWFKQYKKYHFEIYGKFKSFKNNEMYIYSHKGKRQNVGTKKIIAFVIGYFNDMAWFVHHRTDLNYSKPSDFCLTSFIEWNQNRVFWIKIK